MKDVFRDVESEMVFVKRDSVYTDSRTIAMGFNKRHDHILRLIGECISELGEIESDGTFPTFGERSYKTTRGNIYPYYEMDRGAFMFLMMKMRGKASNVYKLRFIQAFNLMEQWIKDRAVGRGVRLSMTDSIKNFLPETPNKKFKYKHFTDLVYKKVLGFTKRQIEEDMGKPIDNLRDICTTDQLKKFEDYENEISVLLKYGKDYKEIKAMLK